MFRYLLFLIGFLLALPILGLVPLVLVLPITSSGIGYLLGGVLVAFGLMLAPWTPKYYILIIIGVILPILVFSTRIFLIRRNTTSSLRMIALPQEKKTSLIDSLIDEQDSVIFGEALFHLTGGDSSNEHADVASALHRTYSEMRVEGLFPSPIASTYLNLQRPEHFDATVIESETKGQQKFGVIFLHGYMGNVSAQCWVIAQAVNKFGGVTVCPSTSWRGEWWQPQGQSILRATFDYLRKQGIQRIYLGGYSNGGFGIGHLASQLGNEKGISGLFFIDGFADASSIRKIGLPILIIQGAQDDRVPAAQARQFAEEVGDLGTYVEIDADHFLIMKQPDRVQNTIGTWLEKHGAGK